MLPIEGPRISGGETYYGNGDVVSVNCTSPKSKPAAQLHWYINDVEVCPESKFSLQSVWMISLHAGEKQL